MRCVIRQANRDERRDWPILTETQSFWLAVCPCGHWAYAKRKMEAHRLGNKHALEVHQTTPLPRRTKSNTIRLPARPGHTAVVRVRPRVAEASCTCGWRTTGRNYETIHDQAIGHQDTRQATNVVQLEAANIPARRPFLQSRRAGTTRTGGSIRIVSGGLPGLGKRR